MNFKIDPYRYFIYLRSYSRWKPNLGRREKWHETITRYTNYLNHKFKGLPVEQIKEAITNQEVMPSMRLLWSAGDAVDKSNAAAYNCLVGDTKILTREHGLILLCEASKKKQVTILDNDGKWSLCSVKNFGKQKVVAVHLTKGRRRKTVTTTLDHNWPTKRGLIATQDLNSYTRKVPGDRLLPVFVKQSIQGEDYPKGIQHGLVFGDGTTTKKSGKKSGHWIRLCKDSKELLHFFSGYKHSYPPSYAGDPAVYLYDKWAKETDLKDFPKSPSGEYLLGFIRGWFAADGSVSQAGQCILTANKRGMDWLCKYSGIVGLPTGHVNQLPSTTNYGKRKEPLYRIYFFQGAIKTEDLLLSKHKRKLSVLTDNLRYTSWSVSSVSTKTKIQEVYCVVNSPTKTFVLDEGIPTGNCSFLLPKKLEDFGEIMFLLMNGCGVGFSCEKKVVSQLPVIHLQRGESQPHIRFADSREGWAEGFVVAMQQWYNGYDPTLNYEDIRSKGSRLQTMGGVSSGPEPLKDLLDFARKKIFNQQGKRLTPINVHDIVCKIGQIVVMGGVRRSSEISLSDLDDADLRLAKSGKFWEQHPHRSSANNSVVYNEKPSQSSFIREWIELMDSGTGERGIFNRSDLALTMPKRRLKLNSDLHGMGTNPCQPGWAKIITPNGLTTLNKIETGHHIWSQAGWTKVLNKQSSGVKKVYKYVTTAGIFYGTKNHQIISNQKKVKVEWAESIDVLSGPKAEVMPDNLQAVMDGLVLGDGSVHKASNDLVYLHIGKNDQDYFAGLKDYIGKHRPGLKDTAYEIKTTITSTELPRVYDRKIPERFVNGTVQIKASFLRGLFSANGSVCGSRITLKATSFAIIEDAQLMLSCLGIRSYWTKNKAKKVRFKNGTYHCRISYDLNINTDRLLFMKIIGFVQDYKWTKAYDVIEKITPGNGKRSYDIIEVSLISEEEVFNITVSNRSHTYWTQGLNVSNCGEILLRDKQFCNLTEIVARDYDTEKSILKKLEVAVILGTYQSAITDFHYLSPEWKENCDKERLLGVSITGQLDCPHLWTAKFLRKMRSEAIQINKIWAKRLGIVSSAAITCVKPSGTVSQLVGASSGLHPRYAPFYIRRVRASNDDPLSHLLLDCGFPLIEEGKATVIFEFPQQSPKGALTRNDLTAMQQLKHWKKLKLNYTEHNPSCFSGNTGFITSEGIKYFHSFKEGDPVKVLNSEGEFTLAIIQEHAPQQIWEIKAKRCGVEKTIRTTGTHLWPITSAYSRWAGHAPQVLPTNELSPQDQFITSNTNIESPEFHHEAYLHGVVFGDGSFHKPSNGRKGFCQIYLCNDPKGADSRELADCFESAGYKPVVRKDKDQIRFYALPKHWKILPDTGLSSSYLYWFIAGWFAADGHTKALTISNVKIENLEWLKQIAPKAGLTTSTKIQGPYKGQWDTYYYTLGFNRSSISKSFFNGFKDKNFHKAKYVKYWKVISVKPTGLYEKVYCVDEPKNHEFVLAGNILTKNCTIYIGREEWLQVAHWLWDNWHIIGGLSFLPKEDEDHKYDLAPYQEITEQQYGELVAKQPTIAFERLGEFETKDQTTGRSEFACVGDACDV